MLRLLTLLLVFVWNAMVSGNVVADDAMASSDKKLILLDQSVSGQLDTTHVDYFVDTQGLGREQVLAIGDDAGWTGVSKRTINLKILSDPVWFRFRVKNITSVAGNWLMTIPWPMLDDLQFSQYSARAGWGEQIDSGYDVPLQHRYGKNRQFIFPIQLQPGEEATLLLRARVSYIMFLPLEIWMPEEFQHNDSNANIWYGMGFGVLVAMLLYNLSLFVFVRDLSYFYYSLYVVSILLYELAATGFGARYLWHDIPALRGNDYSYFAEFGFITASLFVRHFLDLKNCGRVWLQLNNLVLGFWCTALFFDLLGFHQLFKHIDDPVALLTCVIALVTTIYLWRQGNVSARYFTIAWSLLIVLTFITILMLEGVVAYSAVTANSQLAGFVLEMLMLSFALAERINREREQRESAQQLSLQMMRQINEERKDKVDAQEQALKLERLHNEELELRVLDRTAELERTMQNLELANRELARLSVTDPLTKLHNRRYFDQILETELQRAVRTHQPLALIIVDIDHFKAINDTYGHLVGDECLRILAVTLKQAAMRGTDMVARYGGEEFALVLPSTSEADAAIIADRIRLDVEKIQFIHQGKVIRLSASMGVVGRVPVQTDSPSYFIKAADVALYHAKETGRNRVVAASRMAQA